MIQNEEQLKQTRLALADLESAVLALKRDVLPLNPARFSLMAEPVVDQIQALRHEIDEYVGIASAVREEATLWMRLKGPEIELGDAPTSVITATLDIVRKSVQAVAEFLHRGAVGARPTAALKDACDLRIVAWQPGSVQVGLRLPDESPQLFEDETAAAQARQALRLYLNAASWVGSESPATELEEQIPDPEQRRLILNQIARLVPRPRGGLEVVELSGVGTAGASAVLRRESRERVSTAISHTLAEDSVTAEGFLRQIDLDQRAFTIRDPENGIDIRCAIEPNDDDLLEIAKDSLDHRVLVRGIRRIDPTHRSSQPLQVREIEVFESAEGEVEAS